MSENKKTAIELVMELALVGHATSQAIKEDYIETMAKLQNVTKTEIQKKLDDRIQKSIAATKKRIE